MTDSIEISLSLLEDLIDDTFYRAEMAKRTKDRFMYRSSIAQIIACKELIEESGHVFSYQAELDSLLDD